MVATFYSNHSGIDTQLASAYYELGMISESCIAIRRIYAYGGSTDGGETESYPNPNPNPNRNPTHTVVALMEVRQKVSYEFNHDARKPSIW